jgi:hemerythrin superfamily protein
MARRKSGEEGKERKGFLATLISGGSGEESSSATRLLRADHDRVRELFRRYPEEGEGGAARKREIVGDLIRELTVHTRIEEEIFYPAVLDRREKKPEKIVRESFEEHKIVETLLEEISGTGPADKQFDAKVTVLKEMVEHHAREEEDELFPEAERLFSSAELDQMGAQMEDRKEEILASFSRPRRAARSTAATRRRRSTPKKASRSSARGSRSKPGGRARTRKRS